MRWLERYIRRERKHRRRVTARNVRAYRKRQRQAGMKRLDVGVPAEQHAALMQLMQPGKTISQAVGRLLDALTGNAKSI
jgi:phosphopentomutase